MNIINYYKPVTLKEANDLLLKKDSMVIGGGTWLKLLNKTIDVAIDLSNLNLDYINVSDDYFEIGSMTTLRNIEKNKDIKKYMNAVVSTSISNISGLPLRNIATIGGTISGRFGFSDLITALLALDVYLVFYNKGKISLDEYLNLKLKKKDILLKIIIKKEKGLGSFKAIKRTSNDFSILNVCVVKTDIIKISIGSRPGFARIPINSMAYFNNLKTINDKSIEDVSIKVSEEILFATNDRASKEYRKEICKVLVKRGIKEVYYENTN